MKNTKGSCACGKVSYEISGELDDVVSCHCTQCRKQSGHFVAATRVQVDNLSIHDEDKQLRWFYASKDAKRGFCSNCGSSLFWRNETRPTISILVGGIDGPTGLSVREHIYTEEKGDYYEV